MRYLNGDDSLCNINKTFIVLIPKVKDPKEMKDFRPISLCSVIYKVIAKSLAIRLKRVLDHIIFPTQSVFILGRLITNNVILDFECIHAVRSKRKGKEGVATLKLGYEQSV